MTSSTPEVITLQIGHYANFVGTHWWNIQESSFVYDPATTVEIDHAVLFREGETSKVNSNLNYFMFEYLPTSDLTANVMPYLYAVEC